MAVNEMPVGYGKRRCTAWQGIAHAGHFLFSRIE